MYNAYLEANYYHAIDKMQYLNKDKKEEYKKKLIKIDKNSKRTN
ncbi:hypothetical protein [Mycoplasmopsis cynos]|nr:hypothetical protein [Mycoplasmopsis cynos]WAM04864.1 hypothetical protein ONA01_01460 [Mycoplasmopsis cynos]